MSKGIIKENIHYGKIFVSIASYRDPELIPTIMNAIENAKFIDNIIFGICLQDTLSVLKTFPYNNSKHFRIYKVLYTKSKGVCWARRLIQTELLKNEKYYLQIDSHMRFVKDWDKKMMDHLNLCESKKPILSVYPGCYSPYDDNKNHETNYQTYRITAQGFVCGDNKYALYIVPMEVPYIYNSPQKTFYCSGNFLFTYSNWVKECPYNDIIYFKGEEDYIMFESFKNGWDVFYPAISLIYHFYIRENEKKIHSDDNEWIAKNDFGIKILKEYIDTEDFMIDFEKILGINYKNSKTSIKLFNGYFSKKLIYDKLQFKIKRYNYEGGYIEKRYNKVWIEFQNGKEVKAFKELSKENDGYVIYNYDDEMYIKINNKKISFGYKDKNKVSFKFLYNVIEINNNVDSFTQITEQEDNIEELKTYPQVKELFENNMLLEDDLNI